MIRKLCEKQLTGFPNRRLVGRLVQRPAPDQCNQQCSHSPCPHVHDQVHGAGDEQKYATCSKPWSGKKSAVLLVSGLVGGRGGGQASRSSRLGANQVAQVNNSSPRSTTGCTLFSALLSGFFGPQKCAETNVWLLFRGWKWE